MSEDWKIQVSVKLTDGTLINLRAQDGEEIEVLMDGLIVIGDKVANIGNHLQGLMLVRQGLGGQVTDHYSSQPQAQDSGPAQSTSVAPQQDAGAVEVVNDKWGNVWTYGLPTAPMTPRGPAVRKDGHAQASGKPYSRWEDPAKGPKWYSSRQPKPAEHELYPGEFIQTR